MQLGLLIGLSTDRRTGVVLGPIVGGSAATQQIKDAIRKGSAPDPRFPILQAVSISQVLREHRFRPTAAEIEAFGQDVEKGDELSAVLAANEALAQQSEADAETIKVLEASRAEQGKVYETVIAEKCQDIGKLQTEVAAKETVVVTLQKQLDEVTAKQADGEAANARAIAALGEAQEAAKLSTARIEDLTAKLADAEAKAPKTKK